MRVKKATASDLRYHSHDMIKEVVEDRVTFAIFQWDHLVACLEPVPRTKKFVEAARQAAAFKPKPKKTRKQGRRATQP